MNPKLSIIVPVYNAEKYLNKCIKSILNQKINDFELILINDGSTDCSGEICESYAEIDDRIKVIHKENAGQAAARNLGIKLSKGDYIGFIDSDDWIHTDMYSILLKHVDVYQSDIVACNFYVMQKDGTFKKYSQYSGNMELDKDSAMNEIYTNNMLSFSPCNKIYKRSLFDKLLFTEGIILEDKDISYKLIFKSSKISYVGQPLYYYRYNECSTLRSAFTLKRLDEYKVSNDMYQFYLVHYPEISDLVYLNVFNTGIFLYSHISLYYKEKTKDFKYLINFDKKILVRLLKYKKVNFKQKSIILLTLFSPSLFIVLKRLVWKVKYINGE